MLIGVHATFDHSKSSTYKKSGYTFKLAYVSDLFCAGLLGDDVVTVRLRSGYIAISS